MPINAQGRKTRPSPPPSPHPQPHTGDVTRWAAASHLTPCGPRRGPPPPRTRPISSGWRPPTPLAYPAPPLAPVRPPVGAHGGLYEAGFCKDLPTTFLWRPPPPGNTSCALSVGAVPPATVSFPLFHAHLSPHLAVVVELSTQAHLGYIFLQECRVYQSDAFQHQACPNSYSLLWRVNHTPRSIGYSFRAYQHG